VLRDATWTRLRDAIVAHVPRDRREEESRDRFLHELDTLPYPLRAGADPVHVTASAVVVGQRGTVLHVHRRIGRWLQPGGHLEDDEEPWAAAIRETVEETGLPVSHPAAGPLLVHLDVHPAPNDHVHLDLRYVVVSPDRDPLPAPGESAEVRWFSWDEAPAVAFDESLRSALRAARAAITVS
jgi:8-oxo-dGTP pyrophosphatase MutT (NUDIX family)